MAQRIRTFLVDDINGEEFEDGEGQTIDFQWNGVPYTIDLVEKNAAKFEKAITPYLSKARRVSNTKVVSSLRGPRRQKAKNDPAQLAAIREWATANGYEVGDRGRISYQIREAYEDAHAGSQAAAG